MKVTATTTNKQNQSRDVTDNVSKQKNSSRGNSGFVDKRPETKALKSLQMMINDSPRMAAQRQRTSNITGGRAKVLKGPDTKVPNGPAESSKVIRLSAPSQSSPASGIQPLTGTLHNKGIIQKNGKSAEQNAPSKEQVTFAYDSFVMGNNILNMLKHSPPQLFASKYTSLLAGATKFIYSVQNYKENGYVNPYDVFSSLAYVTEGVGENLMIPHVLFGIRSPVWFARVSPISGALADASQAVKYWKKEDYRKTFYYTAYTAGNVSMLYRNINHRLKAAVFATGLLTHTVDQLMRKKKEKRKYKTKL